MAEDKMDRMLRLLLMVQTAADAIDWESLAEAGFLERGNHDDVVRSPEDEPDQTGYRMTQAGWRALFGLNAMAVVHLTHDLNGRLPKALIDRLVQANREWTPFIASEVEGDL